MQAPEVDTNAVRQQYRYELLTWPEINEAVRQQKVVVLPIGSVEQHGWHLPLDVDFRLASSVCLGAGRLAPEDILVMPPVNYGYCHHVMDFPGTVTIEPTTFVRFLMDITRSVAYHGFKQIIPHQWAWLESSSRRAGRATNESSDRRDLLYALVVATDRGKVEHGNPYLHHARRMRACL